MPSIQELEPLVSDPREDLGSEYKDWLNLTTNEHKATLAKAAIALVNHGGGFIILGFDETPAGLNSHARPQNVPEITQDAINSAIRRYASPEFHCQLYSVCHPTTGITHPVIVIPGTLTEPVMSRRDCPGVLTQSRCYIRKPGPRSEEPQTGDEWRALLNRCVRAGRDDMLEAIRSIVYGRVEVPTVQPDAFDQLRVFFDNARERWLTLVSALPADASARMPLGYYEMGFAITGAPPATGLAELRNRIEQAHRIRLTGWPPFLQMRRAEWTPYPHDDFIEAWIKPLTKDAQDRDPAHSDFWRASRDGKLYTIRGYSEDGLQNHPPGKLLDVTLPVWRIGEGLLFARRFSAAYEDVDAILIKCRFTGLNGRHLTSVNGNRAVFGDEFSRTSEITLETQATIQQIDDNIVEVLHQILIPLYERFNFFRLETTLVEEELNRMVRNRF